LSHSTGIYGLVVCGGQSARMGTDKSLLDYYGKPQRYYLYELLQPFCEQVFLSCNGQQAAGIPDNYNTIVDAPAYKEIGPMAALLSAFDQHPDKTFIVLACDYPFFTIHEIKQLLDTAKSDIICAAFCHEESSIYEPLLAVYQPAAGSMLKACFHEQQHSLQRFLKEMQAQKLFPATEKNIQSIDTPEAYRIAVLETKQMK